MLCTTNELNNYSKSSKQDLHFFKTGIPKIYDKALHGKTVHFWQEDPHYIWHCLLAGKTYEGTCTICLEFICLYNSNVVLCPES